MLSSERVSMSLLTQAVNFLMILSGFRLKILQGSVLFNFVKTYFSKVQFFDVLHLKFDANFGLLEADRNKSADN